MRFPALAATLLLAATLPFPVRGESQLDLTQKACGERDAAEERMTRAYRDLQARLRDREMKEALEKAQKRWLAFRDEELLARYPPGSSRGSAAGMCRCLASAAMTAERAETLEKWGSGEPGDVCAGPR